MDWTEQQIRSIIRDELRQIFGGNESPNIKYMPTHQAYKYLGYSNPQQLRDAVYSGFFRIGKEVQDRRKKNALYSNYYFNIPACERRLNAPPEKRK